MKLKEIIGREKIKMIDKIDICVVSRNNRLPKGLEYIPVNNLITSNIIPIGKAREDCIKKVTTEWFAFIDDDIEISEQWFNTIKLYINDNIGAICGVDYYKGIWLFDKYIYNGSMVPKEITFFGRLTGNNTLIKTEYMKDWKSRENLECYEDLVIGRHILDKNKKILLVPAICYHHKNWFGVAKSAIWAGMYFKREHPDIFKPIYIIKKFLEPIKILFTRGIFVAIYVLYQNIFLVYGILLSYRKEVI